MRILVNQAATEVAQKLVNDLDARWVFFSDEDLSAGLDLKPDTVYRALCELKAFGALDFSAAKRSNSNCREITLYSHHWIWEALRQGGAK